MKILLIIIVALFVSQIVLAQDVKLSGFGQVKYENDEFSIPKVRLFLSGPVTEGIFNTSIRYETYVDLFANPDVIGFNPGYASIIINPNDLPVELVLGQTLDPTTYQFPAPASLPVLKYPKASMNDALALGVFVRFKTETIWLMVGIANGEKKSNIKREITSRVEIKLPLGFSVDGHYRGGKDPQNKRREYYGGSITYKNASLWINGGQNHNVEHHFNRHSVGRWIWLTYDLLKFVQVAGLLESLKVSGQSFNGWYAGVNFVLSDKTVARIGYQKRADVNGFEGLGIIFQQKF